MLKSKQKQGNIKKILCIDLGVWQRGQNIEGLKANKIKIKIKINKLCIH